MTDYETGVLQLWCNRCERFIPIDATTMEIQSVRVDKDVVAYCCPGCGNQLAVRNILEPGEG